MRGFRIGRLFGIDLRVDWSWVFIFVLLTWNLMAVFARWHPDWTALGAFVVAISASLLFFGCILMHELAHSVVAMRYGVRVRSITLFLLGGISNIEQEPPSAKSEFLTAIAGPLMSIALGILFLLAASVTTAVPMTGATEAMEGIARLGPVATLFEWLGPINIIIGLFNLVPAFPLDGGRILRSLIWSVTGNLPGATRVASALGQGVGWLFIAGGIGMAFGFRIPFFGTGLVSGLWLAFIGWFLHSAATHASRRLALDETLAGMTVEQFMRRDTPIATPTLSVATLVHEHLISGDDRALPVLERGELLGLVSVSHIRRVPPDQWATTAVGTIMKSADTLCVTAPREAVAKAFEQLAQRDIAQMPVVANGKFVGMLRRCDVTRWIELVWRPGASVAGVNGVRARQERAAAPVGGATAEESPTRVTSPPETHEPPPRQPPPQSPQPPPPGESTHHVV